jgi:light-regulated signal transduction histidine kinase (bacteriophytochrome)
MWALYKELDDKNAALDRSNQELEQFATIASHDLQEPLRKVTAFAALLREEDGAALSDSGLDYLGRMENASERMLVLIGDLLRLARVTSRAQPFEATDLAKIAETVVSDLETQIARENGVVDVGPLPTIDADPVQMHQLLQNLVSNALKFRHEERAPVVRLSADDADQERVRIAIADNGIGLKEKFGERIFEPFRRLHGRGRYEGTGMGLAIVRKIVERHGGEVSVRSEPGAGSTFVALLPRRHETAASEGERLLGQSHG